MAIFLDACHTSCDGKTQIDLHIPFLDATKDENEQNAMRRQETPL